MRDWINLFEETSGVWFHGTPSNSPPFDVRAVSPLTHFGSRAAAEHRIQTKFLANRADMYLRSKVSMISGKIHPVYLHVSNPLRVNDEIESNNHHISYRLVDMLHYDLQVISKEERGELQDQRCSTPAIISIMRDKGFDGFIYRNLVEDAGSESIIVFGPEQVSSAGDPIDFQKVF